MIPCTFTYNDGRFGLLPPYASPSDFADTWKRGFDVLWEGDATSHDVDWPPTSPDRSGHAYSGPA